MDFNKLKEPFPACDIEWRLQQCGTSKNGKVWAICLAYVTNRAIQNRLDEVCGPENWKNEFVKGPDGGVLCGISIKCGNEWVTKWDGAENTNIEAVKGGLSSSMKRSASTGWGIGRYLYDLDEGFAVVSPNGKFKGRTKEGTNFNWDPPKLPSWALPGGNGKNNNLNRDSKAVGSEPNVEEKVSDKALIQMKLDIEGFINNGVLDADPKAKARAEKLTAPDCQEVDKIIACLTFCRELSLKKVS